MQVQLNPAQPLRTRILDTNLKYISKLLELPYELHFSESALPLGIGISFVTYWKL